MCFVPFEVRAKDFRRTVEQTGLCVSAIATWNCVSLWSFYITIFFCIQQRMNYWRLIRLNWIQYVRLKVPYVEGHSSSLAIYVTSSSFCCHSNFFFSFHLNVSVQSLKAKYRKMCRTWPQEKSCMPFTIFAFHVVILYSVSIQNNFVEP